MPTTKNKFEKEYEHYDKYVHKEGDYHLMETRKVHREDLHDKAIERGKRTRKSKNAR